MAPILRRLRNLSLKEAHTNVVLGQTMAARLRAEGVAPDKIEVIHNWSPVEAASHSADPTDNPLRKEWNLCKKFVVGYSGIRSGTRLCHSPRRCNDDARAA